MDSYLVLLQVGFSLPRLLPIARCALTAPFHPYLLSHEQTGGIFSVALSVGSHPPGVTWHPALWSPDFPLFASRTKSDCLTDSVINSSRLPSTSSTLNLKNSGNYFTRGAFCSLKKQATNSSLFERSKRFGTRA